MLRGRADLAAEPFVAGWAECGRPLVACRPPRGAPSAMIAAGLALPPQFGKKRLSVLLPPEAIIQIAPPPSLAEAAIDAPEPWRDTLDILIAVEPEAAVFGGLAWQHGTGLRYLADTSDVDLLFPHRSRVESLILLERVAAIADAAPMRLDGELIRDDGGAVQWRELFDGASEVLVKRMDGVGPMARTAFLS